jgi:hypothetical protein
MLSSTNCDNFIQYLISNFRRVLNIVYALLGISPASNYVLPTFRNPLSGSSSTSSLWRWTWQRVTKRRQNIIWRGGDTQKNLYNFIRISYFSYGSRHLEKYNKNSLRLWSFSSAFFFNFLVKFRYLMFVYVTFLILQNLNLVTMCQGRDKVT